MVESVIADMLLKEMEKDKSVGSEVVDDNELKKVGEELILDKIKNIFDEVA